MAQKTNRLGQTNSNIITPLSTIGIVGGGQLGKMLCNAASALGYKTLVYCPEIDSPAFQVATDYIVASYADLEQLANFAKRCQVITFEFENIPADSLAELEKLALVYPNSKSLQTSQNRLREKEFAAALGIPTAQFKAVSSAQDLENIALPAILKTCEMGYDGKGQYVLRDHKDVAGFINASDSHLHGNDIVSSRNDNKNAPYILEQFVNFRAEISCIVARSSNGDINAFDPGLNEHRNGILHQTTLPSGIEPEILEKAKEYTIKLAHSLDLVGLLTVEYFVAGNELIFNEMAPRPHNSGHHTIEACVTSQFEQQIRAICGLPLGSTSLLCPARMTNLIGDDINNWLELLGNPRAKLHLYGKAESKNGRKMGHVTELG